MNYLTKRDAPFGKKHPSIPNRNFTYLRGRAMLELHLTAIRCHLSDPQLCGSLLKTEQHLLYDGTMVYMAPPDEKTSGVCFYEDSQWTTVLQSKGKPEERKDLTWTLTQ
jgi:hypothetical protein